MRKTGTIQITDELTLKDFNWNLKSIYFDNETRNLTLEVLMWESFYKHSRTFNFVIPESVTNFGVSDAMNLLLQLPQFENSVE